VKKTQSQIGKASRGKGQRGERELASVFRSHGYDARRGVQYKGLPGCPDVVGLPGIHAEVKRTEKLSLYDAVDQAKRDAGSDELPVVFHRRNDHEWLAILPLDPVFIRLYREWEASKALASDSGRRMDIVWYDCSFRGFDLISRTSRKAASCAFVGKLTPFSYRLRSAAVILIPFSASAAITSVCFMSFLIRAVFKFVISFHHSVFLPPAHF